MRTSRAVALTAALSLAGLEGPAAAHPPDGAEPRAVRSEPLPPPGDGAPATVVGDVVVVLDDGSAIAGGTFDLSRVLPAFYSVVPDSFDFVALFGGSNYPDELGAWAVGSLVRIETSGLGRSVGRNRNGALGIHTRRLIGVQLMNDLRHYGPTPVDPVPRFGSLDFTGVELLASEMMHAFGCWTNVDTVVPGADLAGRKNHWSWFLDGAASVMEGARWRDNGDGSFTSLAVLDGLSELDEYLLGLRPASDVAPMFLIANADFAGLPVPGTVVRGTRIDFSIQDVIAQNGPRVPDATTAPHSFRTAFGLVAPARPGPLGADLDYLERFRADWEELFGRETGGVGAMDTSLPRRPASARFESIFAGNPPLTVTFDDRSTGTIVGRRWSFDGQAPLSEAVSTVRTFTRPGAFEVRLEVNGRDNRSTAVRTVTVGGFRTLARHDFERTDGGWTTGSPNDATDGAWEWGDPEPTMVLGAVAQPGADAAGDAAGRCWVTGAAAGSTATDHDVDGGTTTLVTPTFDLTGAIDPLVSYSRWYSDQLGSNSESDSLTVEITSDGNTWSVLETVRRSEGRWVEVQFRIADRVALTDAVAFRFRVADLGPQSLVEAGVDDFRILDPRSRVHAVAPEPPSAVVVRTVGANPFRSAVPVEYEMSGPREVTVSVHDPTGRRIRTLVPGAPAGFSGRATWDGRDAIGRPAAAGVYFVRVETDEGAACTKVVLLR